MKTEVNKRVEITVTMTPKEANHIMTIVSEHRTKGVSPERIKAKEAFAHSVNDSLSHIGDLKEIEPYCTFNYT